MAAEMLIIIIFFLPFVLNYVLFCHGLASVILMVTLLYKTIFKVAIWRIPVLFSLAGPMAMSRHLIAGVPFSLALTHTHTHTRMEDLTAVYFFVKILKMTTRFTVMIMVALKPK